MTTAYPVVITLGGFEITGFGIMMMVGFLMGGWIIDRDLRRRGLNPDYASDIVFAAVIGGIVGAKLWYVALHGPDALFSRGGLVWYGGFVGGTLAVVLNGWLKKVPFWWTAHLVAPALPAAYALGRVGCFMVGDDYGFPTDLPWAVAFPQGLPPTTARNLAEFGWTAPAGMDPTTVLAVHPTQLYEVAIMTAAFMLIWRLADKAWGTGWLFGLYLALAGAERFFVELFRAKDDRFLAGFTLAQVTSVGILVLGIAVIVARKGAARAEPGAYLGGTKSSGKNYGGR
jgi:phosphatidylglycerol:prolipoprotein diacylglycerol transferase